MRMTATSGYALRISAYLFLQDRVCSSAEISRACGIAQCYVAKLARRLRDAGIVDAIQGPLGGYRLACDGRSITVDNLLHAMGDQVDLCVTVSEWERDSSQVLQAAYAAITCVETDVKNCFESVTVADLTEAPVAVPARAFEREVTSTSA